MAAVLEIIGWLIILAVMAALVIVTGNMQDKSGVWLMLAWAVPSMISGLVIMVFARMLGELQAIRSASERQAEIIGDLARRGNRIEPVFGREDPR